jgi:para-nitrobenzyl esterase
MEHGDGRQGHEEIVRSHDSPGTRLASTVIEPRTREGQPAFPHSFEAAAKAALCAVAGRIIDNSALHANGENMSLSERVRYISLLVIVASLVSVNVLAADEVKVESGMLAGAMNADHTVRMFKNIPFAAPPTGDLRWKAPEPPAKWTGVRAADKFGSPCMQTDVFGDIYFRDAQPSEDCLNLDIWIPAKHAAGKIPVFLWYYGGGFVAGSASEPRYDGEALAKKGVIVVNANYRLGVFGFYSHPELTKESGHNSSGNYGLLDQVAALQWVVKNIEAFGGDPKNITIGGESAGSFSVCAQMATPLSKGLFQKAIGESGAFFPTRKEGGLTVKPLAETEQFGVKFAESMGAKSLAGMRAKPANDVLQAAAKLGRGFGFGPNIDGYFFPEDPAITYAKGGQAHVPLLAGWNADEGKMMVLFNPQKPTVKSFEQQAKERFGDQAPEFLKLYPAANDQEAILSAEALASDDFIAYSTWKWLNLQVETGAPVYAYHFEQVPATKPGAMMGPVPASEVGSRHAGEIEYVFQTLKSKDLPWTDGDFKVSDTMSSFWANFVKNGDPNGKGLPEWPVYNKADGFQVMRLSAANLKATAEPHRERYLFLESQVAKSQEAGQASH